MAYPAGVTTRQITFSTITDAEDGSEPINSNRLIMVCNDVIIHISTGRTLMPSPQIYTGAGPLLPVTDQAGIWKDKYGQTLSSPTHSYHIIHEHKVDGVWKFVREWPKLVLPGSGGALDLDTYFDNTGLTLYTPG